MKNLEKDIKKCLDDFRSSEYSMVKRVYDIEQYNRKLYLSVSAAVLFSSIIFLICSTAYISQGVISVGLAWLTYIIALIIVPRLLIKMNKKSSKLVIDQFKSMIAPVVLTLSELFHVTKSNELNLSLASKEGNYVEISEAKKAINDPKNVKICVCYRDEDLLTYIDNDFKVESVLGQQYLALLKKLSENVTTNAAASTIRFAIDDQHGLMSASYLDKDKTHILTTNGADQVTDKVIKSKS